MCTAHVSATFIEKCVHDLILLNPGLAITKLAYNMRDTPMCTPTDVNGIHIQPGHNDKLKIEAKTDDNWPKNITKITECT